MSKMPTDNKLMSISDIIKRMDNRSHVREKSSTSALNLPNVTGTDPNTVVNGYSALRYKRTYILDM